jgi:hypothetical protein
MKTLANESWKVIPARVKKTKKTMFQPSKEPPQPKELAEIDKENFLIELYPTLKEYNASEQSGELGIVGNEIMPKQMCFKCRTVGNEMMRRLACSHCIHDECLRSMLQHEEYLCEIDN